MKNRFDPALTGVVGVAVLAVAGFLAQVSLPVDGSPGRSAAQIAAAASAAFAATAENHAKGEPA